MTGRRRISRFLLQDSEDALRRVSGLLDDAPATVAPGASPFDLHMALGMLDRIYELESAADAHATGLPDRPASAGDYPPGASPERSRP